MKVALTIFWLMVIIPIIWGTLQTCIESSDCQVGKYCDTAIGNSVCVPCISCETLYNRSNSSRNRCAQKVEDCGDCRPGYREENLTANKAIGKCNDIESNSSTSVPALPQLKNTEDEGQLSCKFKASLVLVIVYSALVCVLVCALVFALAYIYAQRNCRPALTSRDNDGHSLPLNPTDNSTQCNN